MLVKQILLKDSWAKHLDKIPFEADLILVFIPTRFNDASLLLQQLKEIQPKAVIAGCSAGSIIHKIRVYEKRVALTAIKFEKTNVVKKVVHIPEINKSFDAGQHLASKFKSKGLRHLLVLSDGLNINADDFLRGLSQHHNGVTINGGLASDNATFIETYAIYKHVGLSKTVTAIGLYSEDLEVCCSTNHGWQPFGINRRVTKSVGNILYEIDGKPALDLLKSYLKKDIEDLPGSALFFPICLEKYEDESFRVRSIVGVNRLDGSLRFAAHIPEGAVVRLMKTKKDNLIEAAEKSALRSKALSKRKPELAIVVGGMGRKLVLKQMADVEIEEVQKILGKNTAITGFYGYGEFMTSYRSGPCQLYNQSLTITTFREL